MTDPEPAALRPLSTDAERTQFLDALTTFLAPWGFGPELSYAFLAVPEKSGMSDIVLRGRPDALHFISMLMETFVDHAKTNKQTVDAEIMAALQETLIEVFGPQGVELGQEPSGPTRH